MYTQGGYKNEAQLLKNKSWNEIHKLSTEYKTKIHRLETTRKIISGITRRGWSFNEFKRWDGNSSYTRASGILRLTNRIYNTINAKALINFIIYRYYTITR